MKIFKLLQFWKLPKKVWISLILIIIAGLYFAFKPQTPKEAPQLVRVGQGDIQAKISGSGTLTGTDSVKLKFLSGGKLAYVNVKEGERVKKGQAIAGVDTQALSIQLQQARNAWLAKDAEAKRVEDKLKDHASDETYTQREERIAAQTARDNAYDSIRAAERAFQDAVISSPINGLVTQASPLTGQTISATDIVAEIVDDSAIYFEAEIDETDIGQVKPQLMAEVTLDAYPDQKFNGTVEKIVPTTKTTTSGATVVIAKINLNSPDITFVNGLNGQADIITSKRSNVLTIPQDSLREDGTVYIKDNNEYKTVKVETGLYSDDQVEIISGLTKNQEIVQNPSSIIPPSNNPITRFIQTLTTRKS